MSVDAHGNPVEFNFASLYPSLIQQLNLKNPNVRPVPQDPLSDPWEFIGDSYLQKSLGQYLEKLVNDPVKNVIDETTSEPKKSRPIKASDLETPKTERQHWRSK